ncbi:3-methyladenine DNA glycosylase 2 [Marinobacter sp. BGYM27]|uniref:DNA-3-methyladenine glycosylase 2 n=1 Tax=Marinobacter sp. BGYM27 TaxID=2975597 RepID=UPI0021A44A5D|nr:3-methyladenine DNA glycosylase 2 [Marinobacter sp. BGYM27]MDG5498433.1 3-methyladenine DNA glycosylase 2 [Marinobacter sp. BGYM27]
MPETLLQCRVDLPAGFRANDVLNFHRRDQQEVSERVEQAQMQKGVIWNGSPACLSIRFEESGAIAQVTSDGVFASGDSALLLRRLKRMLGLNQPIDVFEQSYAGHSQLGAVVGRNSGLRVPQAITPFEAIVWAVIGQQISVSAAVSIRRRLIQMAGQQHSGGLWCHPEAEQLISQRMDDLRSAGLSTTKAATLIALSERVIEAPLPLESWADDTLPVDDIRNELLAIRGIGPWTVSYALLRGFGWLDGSLHGDVAVRRNLQILLGKSEKLTEDETRRWLEEFSPWRALVAAHLWGMQSKSGY